MEFNDIYDENRCLTGRVHKRGTPWHPGEYGLVVCVWVYDGCGRILLTRRAKGKSFAGTWENSGGAAKTGETSRDRKKFYDFSSLNRQVAVKDIVLLPGETDAVRWASYGKIHWMIRTGKICKIIAHQFLRQEGMLKMRNSNKFGR